MTDILCNWLNKEVKLSKQIGGCQSGNDRCFHWLLSNPERESRLQCGVDIFPFFSRFKQFGV